MPDFNIRITDAHESWTCKFSEFVAANDGMDQEEIEDIASKLLRHQTVEVGGGAAASFTIVHIPTAQCEEDDGDPMGEMMGRNV